MISNYNFEGIINGFILDETLIDCNNVICDVNSQILTISKKMYTGKRRKDIIRKTENCLENNVSI